MRALAPSSAAGLAVCGIFSVSAWAQVASEPIQVSTTPNAGDRNSEPVIVASPLNSSEVLVAWIASNTITGSGRIHYRVSSVGFSGTLPPNPSVLPLINTVGSACGDPPCIYTHAADPVVATSRAIIPGTGLPTGDLFLGVLNSDIVGGGTPIGRALGLARKKWGETNLERDPLDPNKVIVRAASNCFIYDRPSLAAGPKPPDALMPPYGANEALYFTWSGGASRSVAAAPLGSAWECDPEQECNGYTSAITSGPAGAGQLALGNPGVVIHAGIRAGRLVVASGPYANIGIGHTPPETTWTDVGGSPAFCLPEPHNPWAPARELNRHGDQNLEVAGVDIDPDPVLIDVPVPSDILILVKSAPSIAVDPNDPSNVYIAFSGRSTTHTPDQIDLFIAWTNTGNDAPPIPPSQVGGPIFQGADSLWGATRRTYRIPDSQLLAPGDPTSGVHAEQFLPAIVIDDLGGINVLFCQAFECVPVPCEVPAHTPVTNRYARWPNRAALDAGQAPTVLVLSPPSVPFPTTPGHDYQGITASGCLVYAAWASKHAGEWQVYVSRITLDCTADADGSGIIDVQDPMTFGIQFAAQQPQADVNEDGLINPQDYSDFLAAYACGACPPP